MSIPSISLVTGGAGFIGSHLVEALLQRGQRVRVLDNLSTGRLENIAHLTRHPDFDFVQGAVEDAALLDRLAEGARHVFHLAAAVGVRLVVEHPVATIETNINGTAEVLRVARAHHCRTVIASSSEVYGKGSKVPFAEEDDVVLGPSSRARWAYAASKMIDEFLGLAYHREFKTEVLVARLFNTVGPRQTGRYGMVIPRLVRQALSGEPLTVHGDGQQTRCFCDVRDIVQALMALAECPQAVGGVFNLGGTEEIAIAALAQRILEVTGSASPIRFVPYDEAFGPQFEDLQRRLPDIRRVRALIGWHPQRSLDEILRDVVEYERAGGPLAQRSKRNGGSSGKPTSDRPSGRAP